MSSPVAAVRAFAQRHGLWPVRLRVVAGVSGGSDSVAMALALSELASAGELELAALVHVNHHVRPGACDADEAFCRALAQRLGVPALVSQADVPALARNQRLSIEVVGRRVRQRAWRAASAEVGAERIATAHTRDDQAETVLLHLMRGAGLSGARGIAPVSGRLIRPVLDCTHDELRAWLTATGQTWCEDETNRDLANPRNRLRHVVLPELRRHFNPALDAALARFADIAGADEAYLTTVAAEATSKLVESNDDGAALAAAGVAALPQAVARRVARAALVAAGADRSYSFEEIEAVVEACHGGPGLPRDFPGIRMERSGRFVVLVHSKTIRPAVAAFRYELPVPGLVTVGEAVVAADGPFDFAQGTPFDLARGQPFDSAQDQPHVERAVVDAAELGDGLVVRSRADGDRVRIHQVGHKKLQDLFVDCKVSRTARDRVPIVTDRSGRIIWVAGYVADDEFRVGPLTNKVVILTLRAKNSAGRPR